MEGGWPTTGGFLLCLPVSLLLQGRANTFSINCSVFDQRGVDPAVFQAIFNQKDFRPVINYSIPTHISISFILSAILKVDAQLQLLMSFLWLKLIWSHPFISWDPEECGDINKLTVTAENLWLRDIFIVEFNDMDHTLDGLSACVTNEGRVVDNKRMQVTGICSLDIYFSFDQKNCTLTFSSLLYTVSVSPALENMLLGMDKEVWEITDTSRDIGHTQGEWELLGINKATPKISVVFSLFDQIMFYVAVRRRPSLYVINLLASSSFLITIDALSFFLPVESENRAPFKMTLLLGYNVFLLMVNDLLPASDTSLISVYFALCLSLMVVSLLETIVITYLLHLATTQPPPRPRCLHSLLLHCTSPRKRCPAALWKEDVGLGLTPTHLSGQKEPGELGGKELGPREAELNGGSGWTRARLADLWVHFSHMMDTLLFCIYLLFLATSITMVIILCNT
ncbi:LOW QUALITY PROTEIN: 5-hydroxytryptamine receptor 3C-like [Mesoplodon densirostris]|uniref:LOW QUALITY PROTEIN: 5-hydroxytryptamine receptor 3C-like n=1 Tax=Mesoplodon densirostris TaxID=48708 RepID=UPI0028DB7A00|nr:LOW QUALITY PROTEIN: 5-hydroxytryptamine receptor 3C-like [Mesoplodon densirostris]